MLLLLPGASVLAELRLVEAELATLMRSKLQSEDFEDIEFFVLNGAWCKVLTEMGIFE